MVLKRVYCRAETSFSKTMDAKKRVMYYLTKISPYKYKNLRTKIFFQIVSFFQFCLSPIQVICLPHFMPKCQCISTKQSVKGHPPSEKAYNIF